VLREDLRARVRKGDAWHLDVGIRKHNGQAVPAGFTPYIYSDESPTSVQQGGD
jgi:hypothetical protein